MPNFLSTTSHVTEIDHSYTQSYQNSGYALKNEYLIAANFEGVTHSIKGKLNQSSKPFFDLIKDTLEKEKLYIIAIKNLIKQKKYLNLVYELTQELITEDEFNTELTENESKYLIKANQSFNTLEKVKILTSAINSLNENLDEDELVEMFSIAEAPLLKIAFANKPNLHIDEAGTP